MVEIEQLTEASERAASDLSALSSALHGDTRTMDKAQLQEMVEDKNILLLVAKDGPKIIAMATGYVIPKVGNRKVYIEDVIVHESYRSHGIGGNIMRALIDLAKRHGALAVELMTRMDRSDAHRFYEKLGFVNKDRHVFKLSL